MSQPIRAKKRWSQNFFQDAETLALCLDPLELQPEDTVLEIGPGQGMLTRLLLQRVKRVIAIEIDPELYRLLQSTFAHEPHLELLHQDFMSLDLNSLLAEIPFAQRKLVANIPYHLTTPILMKVLNESAWKQGLTSESAYFSDIGLMVQKEVAEKLDALPGRRGYGALSVQVRFAAEVQTLAVLPRTLFDPQPQVDSAFVRLQPRTANPVSTTELTLYWRLVQAIYQMRRKTLRNVLKRLGISAQGLAAIGQEIDLGLRGEVFGLEDLARLTEAVKPWLRSASDASDSTPTGLET